MELADCLKDIKKDYQTIAELQYKYGQMLQQHMKLKKKQRNASWEAVRTLLFHLNGALCMTLNGFRGYITKYTNEKL